MINPATKQLALRVQSQPLDKAWLANKHYSLSGAANQNRSEPAPDIIMNL
jgi:hypothetical protein